MDDSPPAPDTVDAPPPKDKPYRMEPLPGGTLPDPGTLFSETIAEFTDHIGPYVMAGLGLTLVVMPVTIFAVLFIYFVVFGGMFAVMIGGAILSIGIAETLGETAATLAILLTQILSIAVPILGMMVSIVGLIAVLAPLNASLARAVAAHQRGEAELELTAAFSTATQDLPRVIGAALVIGTMTVVGMAFCFVGAMVVPMLFGFATTMVAVHRLGAVEGTRTALRHALDHLTWHVTFGLLYWVVMMFASYVPVLGAAFAIAFHVRAYRHVFGDGVEPQLTVA